MYAQNRDKQERALPDNFSLHERLSSKRESRAQSQPALFDRASNISEADTSGTGYRSPFTYPCQARAYGRGGGVGLGRRRRRSIAAYQPNPGRAIRIGGEVAPRSSERRAKRPAIGHRIIDIHLVG